MIRAPIKPNNYLINKSTISNNLTISINKNGQMSSASAFLFKELDIDGDFNPNFNDI